MYTVEEAFEKLKQLGITNNIEVVRRWLRSGNLKGMKPQKRREGWRIAKEDLDAFIIERAPGLQSVINTTFVVNDEAKSENTTKVANEESERLQEEIIRLREQNQRLIEKVALLTAQKEDLNDKLRKPKGLRKRVFLLESAILERRRWLEKRANNDEDSDYFRGIITQKKEELTFLNSLINSLNITQSELSGSQLEAEGINIYGG